MHFVVGDIHGQCETLKNLMNKINYDPKKDHIYFVGDYNGGGRAGGNIFYLMDYLAENFVEDYNSPGFHLIRGNHEREVRPTYTLANLPDIIVLKTETLIYYIAHAGMVSDVYSLIVEDIKNNPNKTTFLYRLDDYCASDDFLYRQIVWSKNGSYRRGSFWNKWPSEENLIKNKSCIIHGHTPYCYLLKDPSNGYGNKNLFFEKPHIWFSEDLQSFNIDSNIKGKRIGGETYRGLSCLCLEAINNVALENGEKLTTEDLSKSNNTVFYSELVNNIWGYYEFRPDENKLKRLLDAKIDMKTITITPDRIPCIK